MLEGIGLTDRVDQILEMAQYIDTRKGSQTLAPELEALIEAGGKETALKKIVDASSVLSSAPEKGRLTSTHTYKTYKVNINIG